MKKTKILVKTISSLTEARYFAAQGVDWMSFLLTPGQQESLTEAELREMREWIHGPKVLGQYVMPTKDDLETGCQLEIDGLFVDAFTPLATLQGDYGVPVFKQVIIDDDNQWVQEMEWASPFVDYFVLKSDGALSEKMQSTLKEICAMHPVLVETSADLASQFIEDYHPEGIVLHSTPEESTGIKSFEEMDDFFDILRQKLS